MHNMKKIALIMGCTLTTVLFLSGCQDKAKEEPSSAEASQTEASVKETGNDQAGETVGEAADQAIAGVYTLPADFEPDIITVGPDTNKFKVGMVTNSGGISDHSFNQSAWEGLCNLNSNNLATVSYIETHSDVEYEADLSKFAEEGYDVIWGIGYQFAYDLETTAQKYPDNHFAVVDYAYENIPENVTCATFKSQEPSFLVGYIAASVSKTGKVGFIGGQDVPAIDLFKYGYMAGVAWADKELGRETEVMSDYIGSFEDSVKGGQIARSMYDEGCDVIFHAAGGAGTGVIQAANSKGKYVIGVDCDQSYLAPENVLTSAIKMVDVAISNISVQYNLGDNIGGKNIEYGLAEHAVGIPEEHPNYSDELYDKVKELENQIIFNEIVVPVDEASLEAFKKEL